MKWYKLAVVVGLVSVPACQTARDVDYSTENTRVNETYLCENFVPLTGPDDFIPLTAVPMPGEEDVEVELFIPEDVSWLPPHPAVQKLIDHYRDDDREKFQKGLERLGPVYPLVASSFAEGGFPEHYLYLGMIESTFKSHARSRAGAFGPWQFMASTGRLYGLQITPTLDERASWEKATRAAVRFLNDLFEEFGTMELAIAAYNAGKGRVKRAIQKCGNRNFWEIRRCLPKETRNFVPSVLAAITIGKDLEKYGFTLTASAPEAYVRMMIPTGVDIRELGSTLEVNPEILMHLNAEYVTGYVPLSGGVLRVPREYATDILPSLKRHEVIQGDTLHSIAKFYRLDPDTLAQANHLSLNSSLEIGMLLLIPRIPEQVMYRIKRGDTLWSISRRYGVSLFTLMSVNGLNKQSKIYPGQKLVIPGFPGRSVGAGVKYRVKKGDTLFNIAARFDTTVIRLKRANGLSGNIIRPGELLLIN